MISLHDDGASMRRMGQALSVLVLTVFFNISLASAVGVGELGNKGFQVRLCPVDCPIVNGHPYKAGSRIRMFETKDGWVRVSGFLDAETLKAKFGDKVPPKPALWVAESSLAGAKSPSSASSEEPVAKPTAKPTAKPAAKPVAGDPLAAEAGLKKEEIKKPKVVVSKQRKVTLPKFRPGTKFAEAAVVSKPVKQTEPKEAKPKPAKKPIVAEAPAKPAKPVEVAKVDTKVVKPEPKAKKAEAPEAKPEAKKVEQPKKTEPPKKIEKKAEVPKPAVVKKPVDKVVEPAAPAKEVKVAAVQPKSNEIEVFVTEERPKTYVKALRDKRLSKLPNSKSKLFKREEVIALRHHALLLLKNKECKGILRGGRSTSQKGWLYITCTDDPTYLRQFSLEEATW